MINLNKNTKKKKINLKINKKNLKNYLNLIVMIK